MRRELQLRLLDARHGSEWPMPGYATEGSAALDLRCATHTAITLEPGAVALVPTGLAIHLADPALCAMVLPRSGLGHSNGVILGNGTGLIDSDYQGELQVSVWNRGDAAFTMQPGDRIAQLVVLPVVRVALQVVDAFGEHSARGAGGFGHTGVQ